jgi:hypothetical protein
MKEQCMENTVRGELSKIFHEEIDSTLGKPPTQAKTLGTVTLVPNESDL